MTEHNKPAPAEGVRLSKVMAERGLASRREADEWIEAGWVNVNGQPAVLGQRVRPNDTISVDPLASQQQAQRVTVLLHKPMGYVSGQAEDGYQPASVLFSAANRWSEDSVPLKWHHGHVRGLAPAGRLDIDSTGLLVLTQDGRIAKQLIGEDSNVEKEYLVRVCLPGQRPAPQPGQGRGLQPAHMPNMAPGIQQDRHWGQDSTASSTNSSPNSSTSSSTSSSTNPTANPGTSPGANAAGTPAASPMLSSDKMRLLHQGLALDGRWLKPARVSWANEDQLRFVLREGRKRQIRRMCELVGLEVLGLKRVRIGSVVLGKLPAGQWRYLRPDERF